MRPNTKTYLNSVAASTNGLAIPADYVVYASAQAVSTGTIVGTLSLQYSNDEDSQCTVGASGNKIPANWCAIGSSAQVSITTGGGVFAIPATQCCYRFIRVVFALTSGTGTVSSNVSTQGY